MGYFLAALLGGFFAFNSQATPKKAARIIQSTLVRKFAARETKVEVEGKRGVPVVKGRFRRVRVAMDGFTIGPDVGFTLRAVPKAKSEGRVENIEIALRDFQYKGLAIASLDVNLRDIAFDWKQLRKRSRVDIVRCGAVTAHLQLAAGALEPFLKTKLEGVKDAKLQLMSGNRVSVQGTKPAPFLDVPIPFALSGKLGAHNGNEIWVDDAHVSIGGVALSDQMSQSFTRSVNPIYVFDREHKTPFRVQIRSMQTSAAGIDIRADLPFVPAAPTR